MDISPLIAPQPRRLEFSIGIAALLVGAPLLLAAVYANYRLAGSGSPIASWVIGGIALILGLLLTVVGIRLVGGRPRTDGGLMSPFVLCIGCVILTAGSIAILVKAPYFFVGDLAILPGIACFVLAWRRWKVRESGGSASQPSD